MPDTPRQISYELTLDDQGPDKLLLLRFEAREGLSDGCAVTVRAASADFVDGTKLVGKPGKVAVHVDAGGARWFHGVITRAVLRKAPDGTNLVEAQIRSRLWLLGLGRDNRVFTGGSVKTVVNDVLVQAGIPADSQTWSLSKDPATRPHIIQREESNLAFVQRLLASEGIGYAIRNGEDGEKIAFFDDSTTLPAIPGEDTLTDRGASSLGTDLVFDVREVARIRSDAVMLRDYDPKLPGANLDVHAPSQGGGGGGTREIYDHPGGYADAAVGKRIAQRTLEAARLPCRTISGKSDCPRLEPGRRFGLEGHARQSLNGAYLVTELVHRGSLSADADARAVTYENAFSAVAKPTPFRPPLAAPLRRGVEVGFKTVPSGEEIHVDEFGRVKVRFPWDRSGREDDTSSEWMRVGQLALGGSMVLPRGGFEVMIDFELGELDRPAVIGHLYNGQSPPPYALPQGATCSSIQTATTSHGPGANELRFEDSAGSEEIFLNASKDLTISVDNDAQFDVGNNETCKVGSNSELLVGTDLAANVVANRKLAVGATQNINVSGDLSESVGKNCHVSVGAARKVQVGGDHAETVTGTLSRNVGALQSVTGLRGIGRNIVGNSKVSVGAAWLETVGRSRGSDVRGSRTETVGALKLIKAKSVSVACGALLTVNAAAEVVKCGGSRTDTADGALAITTGGGLSVKATNITIEAADTLVMLLGACLIKLSSSGKVVIKAPNIDLKGAKALGQIMHASN
jgi:type VI secretion system secreted protein VgrG